MRRYSPNCLRASTRRACCWSVCAIGSATKSGRGRRELGIAHLAPQDVAGDSRAVVEWLESCGASKVLIHFDLDVLDPADLVAAVGVVPDGMTVDQVVRLIGDIARAREVVGLTVAEPMPRTAVRIRDMLKRLPSLE